MGYGHRGSEHRAVSKALAAREVDAVVAHCALVLARLDCLQVALWDDAMDGDARADTLILRRACSAAVLMGVSIVAATLMMTVEGSRARCRRC